MSGNVQRVKHWISLLVDPDTPYLQAKGLISTANQDQVVALLEILHNLVRNYSHLPEAIAKKLRRKKWQQLAQPRKSLKLKKKAFVKSSREVVGLLQSVQDFLKPYIEE